jgi:hypothetical protein
MTTTLELILNLILQYIEPNRLILGIRVPRPCTIILSLPTHTNSESLLFITLERFPDKMKI